MINHQKMPWSINKFSQLISLGKYVEISLDFIHVCGYWGLKVNNFKYLTCGKNSFHVNRPGKNYSLFPSFYLP